MRCKCLFIFLILFSLVFSLYSCSQEPASTAECIDIYMNSLKNDKASPEIERACQGLFNADKTDDEYAECILKNIPGAVTDKDVNIIIRACTIGR